MSSLIPTPVTPTAIQFDSGALTLNVQSDDSADMNTYAVKVSVSLDDYPSAPLLESTPITVVIDPCVLLTLTYPTQAGAIYPVASPKVPFLDTASPVQVPACNHPLTFQNLVCSTGTGLAAGAITWNAGTTAIEVYTTDLSLVGTNDCTIDVTEVNSGLVATSPTFTIDIQDPCGGTVLTSPTLGTIPDYTVY